MCQEKEVGVSVHISPDIVAALNVKMEESMEAATKAGLDPLSLVRPSIGWQVRTYLRSALGMNQTHGGE